VIVLRARYEEVEAKLPLIEGWAKDGLSEKQIASNLGIAYSTFRIYRDKHETLSAALKASKDVADIAVENALYRRAVGSTYTEMKKVTNPDGSVVITEIVKEVPADTTAASLWLRNRKPKEWRDKQEFDVNSEITYSVIPNALLAPESEE